MIYQEALEFMGEARAGMSWERFSMQAVRYSDVFIDILNGTETVRRFLSGKDIDIEYVSKQVRDILERLHYNPEDDHYLTLSLPRSASAEQIHRRWKDLMLIYHPDRSADEDAAGCAKRINAAYNILKNPEKKREYDMRTTVTGNAYVRTRLRKVSPAQRPVRLSFISPEMRRLLPKLILPCSVLVSLVILLIIFLSNSPESYLPTTILPQREQGPPVERTHGPLVPKGEYREEAPHMTPLPDVEKFYRGDPEKQPRTEKVRKEHVIGKKEKETLKNPESLRPAQVDETVKVVSPVPAGNYLRPVAKLVSSGNVSPAAVQKRTSEKDAAEKPLKESFHNEEIGSIPAQSSEVKPGGESLYAKLTSSETEVFYFMVRYVQAYEEGDISKFMTFFSQSAIENGSRRYEDIRRSYKKNFETSKYSYTLKNLNIQQKEGMTVVTGDYSIKKMTGRNAGPAINGKATWTLIREDGNLKIAKIGYDKR